MNEQEEFEFRLRFERENAITGSAPSTQAGVEAAFGKPDNTPSLLQRLGKAGLSGSLKGGPIPGIASMAMEGADIASEAYNKGAYEFGGTMTDLASRAGAPPEIAAGVGQTFNVGGQVLPAVVGMGEGKLATSLLNKPASWLMRHSMAPDRTARISGEAERAVGTMLERDISPTSGGLEKAKDIRDKLESKVDEILKSSTGMVSTDDVALQTLKKSISKIDDNSNPAKDMRVIDNALNTFLEHGKVEGRTDFFGNPAISVKTANELKQGIYAELRAMKGNVYGPSKGLTPTEVMTKQDRASSLREAVGTGEPKVVPTLAEQSEVMNVISTLKPQVSREGFGRVMGVHSLSPRLENVLIWMVDRYPWMKSYVARSGYTLGKHPVAAGETALTLQNQP